MVQSLCRYNLEVLEKYCFKDSYLRVLMEMAVRGCQVHPEIFFIGDGKYLDRSFLVIVAASG
jgi:hypothetical protein